MRRTLFLSALVLVTGCSLDPVPLEGRICRSYLDCLTGQGYFCQAVDAGDADGGAVGICVSISTLDSGIDGGHNDAGRDSAVDATRPDAGVDAAIDASADDADLDGGLDADVDGGLDGDVDASSDADVDAAVDDADLDGAADDAG